MLFLMFKKIVFLFILLGLALAFWPKDPAHTSDNPQILVSIAPYAFFVHQIAGPELSVTTLIPEGANPHLYEPTPRGVARIRHAAIWIRLGESFDQKVYQVFQEQNPNLRIVDIAQGIDLLSACGHTHAEHPCQQGREGQDMHIWLSPRLAKIQAQTIADALIETFPDQQPVYAERLQVFLKKLDALDAHLTQQLTSKKGQAILVSHPAFAYFCQDYGLIQLSVEMEGKEPLPQQITKLLNEARRYEVTTVLLEPQYSNKGAELIAKELQVPTATVDPYAENYIDNLKTIADIISQ